MVTISKLTQAEESGEKKRSGTDTLQIFPLLFFFNVLFTFSAQFLKL